MKDIYNLKNDEGHGYLFSDRLLFLLMRTWLMQILMYDIFSYLKIDLSINLNIYLGSLGIAPTRDYIHFLKIGFLVAGVGLYSYYIHQGNRLDKERKIVRKRLSFMHTKRLNTFF